MVYVKSITGQPLMPTKRHGFVRRLLKTHRAKVIQRCPFTIQLLYESGSETQPVVLGVDAGSKHVGFSACTEREELYTEVRESVNILLVDTGTADNDHSHISADLVNDLLEDCTSDIQSESLEKSCNRDHYVDELL